MVLLVTLEMPRQVGDSCRQESDLNLRTSRVLFGTTVVLDDRRLFFQRNRHLVYAGLFMSDFSHHLDNFD